MINALFVWMYVCVWGGVSVHITETERKSLKVLVLPPHLTENKKKVNTDKQILSLHLLSLLSSMTVPTCLLTLYYTNIANGNVMGNHVVKDSA